MVKPLSSTSETPFCVKEEEWYWKSVLMLGDCVGERLILEVMRGYESCKLVITPSFGCKISLWCAKKWQFRWIWTPRVYSLFGGRLGLRPLCDCKSGWVLRRLSAGILLGNMLGSVTGKTKSGGGIKSNQLKGGTKNII